MQRCTVCAEQILSTVILSQNHSFELAALRAQVAELKKNLLDECRKGVALYEKHEDGPNSTVHQLNAQRTRVAELEAALESIREYWNGLPNESAMQDACEHAVQTANKVLGG